MAEFSLLGEDEGSPPTSQKCAHSHQLENSPSLNFYPHQKSIPPTK